VDMVTRRKLRRELVRIRQNLNIPIIFVTHDLDEARMLADRLCIIHEGELLQSGIPGKMLTRPSNARVARLLDLNNIFKGTITAHDEARSLSLLDCGGITIECALRDDLSVGQLVDWVIPSEGVILHRVDRPSKGERENPIAGIIEECIALGENTSVIMRPDCMNGTIGFTVSTHVARRNQLEKNRRIRITLLTDHIHLMP